MVLAALGSDLLGFLLVHGCFKLSISLCEPPGSTRRSGGGKPRRSPRMGQQCERISLNHRW
jgi:hypothetical protein